jgi:hypothetical protein
MMEEKLQYYIGTLIICFERKKNVVYVSYNTIISLVLIMGLILCMWVLHFLETRWWEKGRWCCHRLSTTWLSLVMLYPCNFTIKCLILSYYIRATYESFVSVLLFSYLNAMQIESKCELPSFDSSVAFLCGSQSTVLRFESGRQDNVWLICLSCVFSIIAYTFVYIKDTAHMQQSPWFLVHMLLVQCCSVHLRSVLPCPSPLII